MSASGDDFCTPNGEDLKGHCGFIRSDGLSECVSLAVVLVQECAQMPMHDATVRSFVKGIGLETCCVTGGDIYDHYNQYMNKSTHKNSVSLCRALWKHLNPDSNRLDTVHINTIQSVCTYSSQFEQIIIHLRAFIQRYQQYLSRPDIHGLLDQLIAVTYHMCWVKKQWYCLITVRFESPAAVPNTSHIMQNFFRVASCISLEVQYWRGHRYAVTWAQY